MALYLQLDRDTLEVMSVAAAAAAGVCLLLVVFALARVRALGRQVRRLSTPGGRHAAGAPAIDRSALRHVAVVRYDAFGDMGGRLSFSAAVLDDDGNGFVLSSINGRSETRTYAKALAGLASDHALSPEEQQAIREAQTH